MLKTFLVLFLFLNLIICHSHTFKRKYFPFKVISQMDLLRPSLPFPGIFDISAPSAKFFRRVKLSDKEDIKEIPNLDNEFGKKKFIHYYPELFQSNEGLNIQNFIQQFDVYETTLNLMKQIVNDIALLEDDEEEETYNFTSYYTDLLSEYEPSYVFFDKYTSRQYYLDLINFMNKMKDSVQFYKNKKADPLSKYFNSVGRVIVEKLNEYRKSKNLSSNIEWSELSYYQVLEHSLLMSNIGRLTHDGFNERTNELRKLYPLKSAAENLASFQNFELITKEIIAEKFMDLWITSKSHRLNMEKNMNRCTVAIYKNEHNVYYGTMFLFRV